MKINTLIAHSSNYSAGRTKSIEYLVIHYTSNDGDTAKGNCKYFQTPDRNASANYFVDELEIWQSVADTDTAWHCGTNKTYYHPTCRNNNSIGIELCSRKDSQGNYYFKDEVLKNAIELVKSLMNKYNIPIQNIIRHYDVTHKTCPAPMVNDTTLWNNFKNMLQEKSQINISQEKSQIIKRSYVYGDTSKEIDVINLDGNNYAKVRDLLDLLGKEVSYDANTKVTTIK